MTRRIVVTLALLAAVPFASAGYRYEAVTTVQTGDRGRARESMRVTSLVDGAAARIAFEQGGAPGMPSGGYMITRDAGKTLYMIDPAEKTYTRWDVAQIAGMMGAIMDGGQGVVSIRVIDPQVEELSRKPGDRLLDHPTEHSIYRSSYTLEMNVLGFRNETQISTVEDIWTTTALKDKAFDVWRKAMTVRTGHAEIDNLIDQHKRKLTGFPLKVVTVMRTTGKGGRVETTTSTMEVTSLTRESVDPAVFRIPEGYTEVEMKLDGAPPEEREAPREQPAGLRDLMRRFGR